MVEGVIEGFLALFVIMDPIGNIPLYLPLVRKKDAHEQKKIVLTAASFATFLLLLFLFCGQLIFEYLNFQVEHIMIAGGILMVLLGFQMMFGTDEKMRQEEDIALVPLGMPLMSGPGSIATILLLGSTYGISTSIFSLALVMPIQIIIYIGATRILDVVGINGINIMAKVSALVAASFGVTMIIKALQIILL